MKWKIIHYVCSDTTSFDTVKFIIDKYIELNLNINCSNSEGWQPIHFICRNSSFETIKYIVDKYALHKYVKNWHFSNCCSNKHFECIINNNFSEKGK